MIKEHLNYLNFFSIPGGDIAGTVEVVGKYKY